MDRFSRLVLLVIMAAVSACAAMETAESGSAGPTGDAPSTPQAAADPTPGPTGEPQHPPSPPETSGGEEDLWESLLNGVRAQARVCGAERFSAAPPLRWEPRLGAAAREHSRDMAAAGRLSHSSRDGRTPWDRIAATGYEFSNVAENVAGGQPDPQAAVASWVQSPGHCANIMNPDLRDFGAGGEPGATGTIYWTLKLGASF